VIARARTFVTAALLGLPIALFAHALVFGGEHAAGGAFSSAALAAGALGLVLVIALHSRCLVQGSVLAARLRDRLPSFIGLAATGTIWFGALELCENAHSLPLLAIAAALFAACVLVRTAVCAVARSIADIAIVLTGHTHVPARAESRIQALHNQPVAARSFAHVRRLFSRPPPALS
jgi:hypothetical protein